MIERYSCAKASLSRDISTASGAYSRSLRLGVATTNVFLLVNQTITKPETWANAQRDGRPAEYRWRPLFNAAKFG